MCNFFSVVSDGKGNVKHFTVEDVVKIMVEGNPESYDFNSHTSLMHFLGIKGRREDKFNKWEYSPEKEEIKADSLVTTDDRDVVRKYLKKYFSRKDVGYLRNLFGRNSGNRNSGNGNSGDGALNSFCTERQYILFNKPCSEKEYQKVNSIDWSWFVLTEWISESEMTAIEKETNPFFKTTEGYLKTITYKEAWEKCPEKFIREIKKLKNFDAGIFEEITGIKI